MFSSGESEKEAVVHSGNKQKQPSFKKERIDIERGAEHLSGRKTMFYLLAHFDKNKEVCSKVGITVFLDSRLMDYKRTKELRNAKFEVYGTILCANRDEARFLEKELCKKMLPYKGREFFSEPPAYVFARAIRIGKNLGIPAANMFKHETENFKGY